MRSIGEVGTVPRQEVVHQVQNGQGEMRSISGRARRQTEQLDDVAFNAWQLRWNVQFGDALQKLHASRCRPRITTASLIKREHGSVEAEPAALVLPPLMRRVLVSGNGWLAAWVCCQVAGDRRLDVTRLHDTGQ